MKPTKNQIWIAGAIILCLLVLSRLGRESTPYPGGSGYMLPYEQDGYDPVWYGEPGPTGPHQSPISGWDTTGVEVLNNPDATDWRDMVIFSD